MPSLVRCLLWGVFAGGLARVVSLVTHGPPPAAVLILLVTELALPPLMLGWLAREQSSRRIARP